MRTQPIRALIIAHLILLGLGCTAIVVFSGNELTFLDEREYLTIAQNLASEGMFSLDGIHPTAYRPPLFPALLALLLWCGADIVMMKSFNMLLLVSASFLLSLILLKRFGWYASFASVVLIVCYPVLWYSAGTLYPQILGAFFLIVFLAVTFLFDRESMKSGPVLGGLLGLMILTIPTFAFLLPIVVYREYRTSKRMKKAVTIVLCAAAVTSSWMFRNYTVFNEVIFISTNSGLNLLVGNSEHTTASSGTEVDLDRYISAAPKGNEAEIDRYFRNQALNYMNENRQQTVALYIQKVFHHFSFYNSFATANVTSLIKHAVMAGSYAVILLLAVIRMRQSKPLSDVEILCLTVYITAAFVQGIFFTRIRFRIPFDLLLIVVSSVGIHYHLMIRKERTSPSASEQYH